MKTSFLTKLLDFISPRLCVVCGSRLSPEESLLCVRCMLHLPLTGFEKSPADNPLARLFWGQFPIERATALYYYEPQSEVAEIIYSLKYRSRPEIGRSLGHIMARQLQASGFFDGIDALVPVPLAPRRRRQRGYNQSEEIARGIAELTALPIYNKVVRRTQFDTSQTRLNPIERRDNVERAFQLADSELPAHRHLLLIDDIVTTGSTLTACARQLLKAKDVKLSVLAIGFAKY